MKKILLVDDEIIIRKLARNTIQGQGYNILEASNGDDALNLVKNEKPDLVLLDINMKGIDGFQVCKTIKSDSETKDTIVIMLTGEQSQADREMGLKVGADDFFGKPFSPIELLNKIRNFLETDGEIIKFNGEGKNKPFERVPSIRSKTSEELFQLEREQLLLYASDLGKIYNEELKQARELKQAYQRMKKMERMKDAFISLVSHELRTPLSIIKGYISLINEVIKTQKPSTHIQEFVKAIAQASDKLESLIQELLDFSKMKSGLIAFEKEEISIPGILQLIINEFISEANKKGINIELIVDSEFRPLRADRTRLKEAIGHLIKNAIVFTPSSGKVWLEAVDEGVKVKIRVCDTGKGISEDEVENIFSPFYQSMDFLTRDINGIGLGLTITKHIIEDHGGTIDVESEIGKGSVFEITLPRSFKDAKEIASELQEKVTIKSDPIQTNLQPGEKQILSYAQDMNNLYRNERLEVEQLQQTLKELELTYVQTIAALAQAIDIKDSYLGGHTGRVSYYANCIAKHYNPQLLKEKEFIYGLLLHDVGKIGIAEEILGKAGKLSNDEWDKIKAHPEMGARILDPIKFLSPALSCVRSHHERWDGKGYPDGLRGEEIPISARIISVADAYDAMTTDRPYRRKLSKEEAKKEIEKNKGIQFDPKVVASFFSAWDEISVFGEATE